MTVFFSIIPWADLSHREGRGTSEASGVGRPADVAMGSPRSLAAQGQARHSAFTPSVTVRKTDAGSSARASRGLRVVTSALQNSRFRCLNEDLRACGWAALMTAGLVSVDPCLRTGIREVRPAGLEGHSPGWIRGSFSLISKASQKLDSSLLSVAGDLQILYPGILTSLKILFQLI